MPTGDPMWTCPFCKQTYYSANQTACSCKGWMNATTSLDHHTFAMPGEEAVKNCVRLITDTDEEIILHKEEEHLTTRETPETLVVNLFAGPGAGKSTAAAGIFFELKSLNINAELAAEYAKDLVWEERHQTFDDQIYIFGKQYHRIYRLLGQVQVIITDSPLLLTPIYDAQCRPTLEKLVVEEHNKMWTYNAFINRKKPFNSKGRNQNEEEARRVDIAILNLLDKHNVCYEVFDGTHSGRDAIVKKILMLLKWKAQ